MIRSPSLFPSRSPGKYARPEALRLAYATQLVTTSLCILPFQAIYYTVHPGGKPRKSWSITESVLISFLRRVSRMQDQGLTHGIRDITKAPKKGELKETTFEWVPMLREELMRGVVKDEIVSPMARVGVFVWERRGEGSDAESKLGGDRTPKTGLVGIYLHGGGYTNFSAHENCQTSKIPRRLIKMPVFSKIYSVEYRLLPSPFPAALQDAAAVFVHLVEVMHIPPESIILIGDSAGGNLAMALTLWIRDEKISAMLAHGYPLRDPPLQRPNAASDYLCDTLISRSHLVTTFLGPLPHSSTSPYISPASTPTPHPFEGFPATFVHYGGAERLEDEIDRLVERMREDMGDGVEVLKSPDTPHDVMMMHWWNEKVRNGIGERIEQWAEGRVGGGTEERGMSVGEG